MSVKRFKCLSRFIHFQDNDISDPAQDRLYKITPVLKHFRQKFLNIESENKFLIAKVWKHKKLKMFRLEVAEVLIHGGKKKGSPFKGREEDIPNKFIQKPKTPRPLEDIRYEQVDHFPFFTDKGRCRFWTDHYLLPEMRSPSVHRHWKKHSQLLPDLP